MKFRKNWLQFYNDCLDVLKDRPGFNEPVIPILERYVFASMKASQMADEIAQEPLTVKHTNNKSKTNEASSPKARMFVFFSREAAALAKELGLSPAAARMMKVDKPKTKTVFNCTSRNATHLDGKMKIA